jgi:uncharacterized membrane protein
VSLVRLRGYLQQKGRARLASPTDAGLHVLAAVGIFLGRFERLNSCDIFARPNAIAAALRHLTDRRPVAIIAAVLIVIAVDKAASVGFAQMLGRAIGRLRILSGERAG